jgi:hypothetical protein
MTVEEKLRRLSEFCEGRPCSVCALCEKDEAFCDYTVKDFDAPDRLINEDYNLVFCSDGEIGEAKSKDDPVNHPSHYTDGKIEVIDFIEDKKLGFCLGNAVKYIARAGKKDPTKEIEDLKKADWYVNRRIKEVEELGQCVRSN